MRVFVQLGWIQDIIDWIFDKILNPVFKWLSGLLSDVFRWIFDNVLGPILETVFTIVAETIGKLIMRLLGRYLYIIEKSLLMILDVFQDIFNVLAGTTKVSDKSMGAEEVSLLALLVRSPFVFKAMGVVIMISVVLVFFFAIIATIRSIGDMGGQQSVGKVLSNLAHALLRMITAPLMGLFLVVLGDAVLLAITSAMTLGTSTTIARSLFTISTLDAVEDEYAAYDKDGNIYDYGSGRKSQNPVLGYNYSTRSEWLSKHPGDASDYGLRDKFREPFYTGEKDLYDTETVEKTFNFGRMNFLVGIGGTLLFIYIVGSSLFVFVSRMFDLILLLIIEPFFLAPMPLDDGEHFKKWEDMFIAKLFSGYGMVVAMYLYLLVCSIVFEGRISLTPREGVGDIMMDMIMKMVLLYGGAATMMTAGPLITSLLNSTAAQHEGQAFQAGQSFTNTVVMKPLNFATKKAVMAGARALTGGKNGLVGQAEKAYTHMKGGFQKTKSVMGGGPSGPGGSQGGGPIGGQDGNAGGIYGGAGGIAPRGQAYGGVQGAGPQLNANQAKNAPVQSDDGKGAPPPVNLGADMSPAEGVQAFSGLSNDMSSAPAALGGSGREGTTAPANGSSESNDDFDTIFDVGGKSLFDEPEQPAAGDGNSSAAANKTASPRPRAGLGYAWRAKASIATINATRAKYGLPPIPEKKDSGGDLDMKDIVGGDPPPPGS